MGFRCVAQADLTLQSSSLSLLSAGIACMDHHAQMCVLGGGICVAVCMWVFRSQHWVSSALHTIFNRLLLNLEFTD